MHSNKPKNSEVDAYTYIKEELEKLGWNVKNPARVSDGEVYKQNEVLAHKELKKYLVRDMPEAVVKLNENEFWAIESKRDKKDIDIALNEAIDQYAKKINQSGKIKCVIASGVAGNDTDGYKVINKYLKNGKWETILFNGKTKNILLSKNQARYILEHDTINWLEFPDLPETKYISAAVEINEILHNAGINKNKRARFIAGLVLSLSVDEEIDLTTGNTKLLVKNINNLIERKLEEVKKENFIDFLKLELPPSTENHIKYRQAIIETLKELQTLDIKNAMASGKDVLGEFYDKFLKYGNGAKEIGIVLTPRHITKFAVEVLNVKFNDYVLDPACGTGGFLVSAFDYVRNSATPKQIDEFKNYHIFGTDQDDEVIALALVNMIFRGDGRNNMNEGNCFQKSIEKTNKDGFVTGKFDVRSGNIPPKNPIITKVLMNPPFALKKGDEKESDFIDYALSQMEDGGILFVIVPISVMVEGSGKNWRKELLENNTVLSVVTFPEDLFYPVSVGTIGVFVKKGIPHDFDNQKVYFARAIFDGFRKKKGKRIVVENSENTLKEVEGELKGFLANQNLKLKDVPEFKKICLLDKSDIGVELVPEAYIESKIPTLEEIENGVGEMIREAIAFRIKYSNKLENKK
ncbi:MAG: DNA methyltransferase [Parcubacteria group bacterium CG10_big_fil_rev_8_21_14_0_10_36_14]|nr:MAG: DNA methyltransferase [Parcubacteria group bacterium CG10_big_fil_rev_8_21_14_0_10_36_14]